jgi:hypothetical protein
MELKPFGNKDILRIVITFIVVLLVIFFVTPYSQWIVIGAIGVLIYTLILEFVKYYLGLKEIGKKKFEIATLKF